MNKILFLNLILLGLLGLSSWDELAEDALPIPQESLQLKPAEKEIFIYPGGEALIDLRENLKVNSHATLAIAAKPGKGDLEFIESGLLRYTAHKSFTSGQDHFVLKILMDTALLDQIMRD